MNDTKRRNDLDIVADILQVARAGAKKTQIVYQANLNFKIVKGYLKRLIDNKMLRHDAPHYYTTETGTTYLSRYKALTGLIPLFSR